MTNVGYGYPVNVYILFCGIGKITLNVLQLTCLFQTETWVQLLAVLCTSSTVPKVHCRNLSQTAYFQNLCIVQCLFTSFVLSNKCNKIIIKLNEVEHLNQ